MQVLLLSAILNRHKRTLRMIMYQVVRIAYEMEILRELATVLCYM